MVNFNDLMLSEPVLRGIHEMGFEEPTAVQERTIPPLKEGRDLIVQALTGTGKTAAFGIPLVERIDITRAKCSVSEMFVGLGSQEFALIRVRRHLGCSRGIPHCLIGVEAIEKLH